MFKRFLRYYEGEPKKIKKNDVYIYLDKLLKRNRAGNTINVNLNALKFLMEDVLHKQRFFYNIKFSKPHKSLPEVLSQDEVKKLIEVINNRKHKLMVSLMYAAGLRVSELVHLKVGDLELNRNLGWVRKGKGNKDRSIIVGKYNEE